MRLVMFCVFAVRFPFGEQRVHETVVPRHQPGENVGPGPRRGARRLHARTEEHAREYLLLSINRVLH